MRLAALLVLLRLAALLQRGHHVLPTLGVYAELLWWSLLCVLEPRWSLHSSWRGR